MLKLVFFADTHLGFDFPLRPKKKKRRRGTDFFNNFETVLEYAKTSKADIVIHGGDLFYRTLVPPPIVDMVYERIFNFAESDIPIVIVPGNHESSRLPISIFMQHPNIHYFIKPQVFTFKKNGIDLDVAGFPCVRKEVNTKFSKITAQLQPLLRKNAVKILCMHQSIEGAKIGPSDYTFRYGKDVIPINQLRPDYNLFLSGHIHRQQILWTEHKTPIIYPGSIERTAFAEKNEEKGFYEIKIDNTHQITYKFIKLPSRPMIDIQLNKESYSTTDLVEEIVDKIKGLPMDSILRFRMKHSSNLSLLKVKLLDDIIPRTMNYQVAGLRELRNNGN